MVVVHTNEFRTRIEFRWACQFIWSIKTKQLSAWPPSTLLTSKRCSLDVCRRRRCRERDCHDTSHSYSNPVCPSRAAPIHLWQISRTFSAHLISHSNAYTSCPRSTRSPTYTYSNIHPFIRVCVCAQCRMYIWCSYFFSIHIILFASHLMALLISRIAYADAHWNTHTHVTKRNVPPRTVAHRENATEWRLALHTAGYTLYDRKIWCNLCEENIGHEPFYILTAVENVLKLNYVVRTLVQCACVSVYARCACATNTLSVWCACSMPIAQFFLFLHFISRRNAIYSSDGGVGGGGANGQTALHVFRWQMQFVFLISVHTMWQMINAIRKMISKTTTIIRHFKKSKWHTEKLERASKFLPLWRFAICFFER